MISMRASDDRDRDPARLPHGRVRRRRRAVRRAIEHASQAILREASDRVPDDVGLTTRLVEGFPTADHRGGRGRRGRPRRHRLARPRPTARRVLGSVSQAVLHHSPVPVLVAHAPKRDRASASAAEGAAEPAQATAAP